MKDIINHKHTFFIEGKKIELTINFIAGLWKSEITKGKTGVGTCSGGVYQSLEEYISAQEMEHRYGCNFYNHGYAYAKSQL